MSDAEEKARKERAQQKFMQERAALLAKAQKRLAEAEEEDGDDEPKWTTDG